MFLLYITALLPVGVIKDKKVAVTAVYSGILLSTFIRHDRLKIIRGQYYKPL